jgi:hypothetical protein
MKFFLPIFEWSDQTQVAIAIRNSRWLFPVIETFHLLALALLLGTVIIMSLRLFGLAMMRERISELAKQLAPWTVGALCVLLPSGWLLFASEAFKCYDSIPFRVKMVCLLLALTYHFTFYRKIVCADDNRITPFTARAAGIFSLALWFSVGLGGRAIGFL